MDGGMTTPKDPADVASPIEKRSSYPDFTRAGIMTVPMATTVAGLEPEIAAKKRHARVVATANPPG